MTTKFRSKIAYAFSLAVVLALLLAPLALADTTVSDGDGMEPVNTSPMKFGTVCAGSTTTQTALIRVNRNGAAGSTNVFKDGSIVTVSVLSVNGTGLSATMDSPNTITLPSNWSSLPNNTDSDYVSSDVTFIAGAAGSSLSGSVTYRGTGINSSDNTINRDATMSVAATVVDCTPVDTTPPMISYSVNGLYPETPDGLNGWYVHDVFVDWTVSDPESSFTTDGCVDTTINTDTAGTTLSCSATSAGGTSSKSVTIKRDATAPTISGGASPAANGNGWNNTDVTVTFLCDDNLSGVASCGPDKILSSEGADQSASGTAFDHAGNSTSKTVIGINIDKTAPEVKVTGVANGETYILGSVPAAGCSTTDGLSGVATFASLSLSGGPVGAFTATCSGAMDKADNPGSASATYLVVYDWDGFFRPVDNLPTLNVAKAGSAIPVKFSLSGDQGLGIIVSGYPTSKAIACDATVLNDPIEETVTAGSSSLTYDALADQYIYVWKTDKAWAGSCRQFTMKLNDTQIHQFNVKFSK